MKMLFNFRYFKEVYYAFGFLMTVMLVGTLGFKIIEGYSLLDAFYMTVITVSTVGYREVQPLTPGGKLFTAFLIISTFGTFAYTVSSISKYLITGEFRYYFRNFKAVDQVEHLNNHVIICGYGRNGRQAARTLLAHKQDFVVIEQDEALVDKVREESSDILIMSGDSTDETSLEHTGLMRAKALITTLPKDADNLFVVLTAREINKNITIISRASDPRNEKKLRIAGADNVIMPDQVGGSHMASLVMTPDLMDFLDHISIQGEDETNLVEILVSKLPSDFQYKSIVELEQHHRTGSRIIGFKTPENQLIINPAPDTALVPRSKLFVLGKPEQISLLKEALHIDA